MILVMMHEYIRPIPDLRVCHVKRTAAVYVRPTWPEKRPTPPCESAHWSKSRFVNYVIVILHCSVFFVWRFLTAELSIVSVTFSPHFREADWFCFLHQATGLSKGNLCRASSFEFETTAAKWTNAILFLTLSCHRAKVTHLQLVLRSTIHGYIHPLLRTSSWRNA
jgi:hypothetical protein